MIYPEQIQNLPIAGHLDQICATLKNSPSRTLVLTAQTAAGKSTAVPFALLKNFSGKILMLEPRRLAVYAIASRVAFLLGEKCGQTAGYTVRLDSKKSNSTRFEVVTEAVLTKRLQSDPLLEDVSIVVLDEFHERSIHADLALAFLKQTMELRDDLYIIIMSATIDSKKIAEYLGTKTESAPILQIPGKQFPVKIVYDDKSTLAQAVLKEFYSGEFSLKSGAALQARQSLEGGIEFRTDTILVFLSGIYEITKLKSELESKLLGRAEIFILHSSISLDEQKKILAPVQKNCAQRIILSSAIAETSLTIPGVTTVIDFGYTRLNKLNIRLGMEHLVTEKISQFSADQRAGRAGRIMSGKCIRLWNEHERLFNETAPEILRTDLTPLVLECFAWGIKSIDELLWLDKPSESSWNSALKLLQTLGFVKQEEGTNKIKITQEGKNAVTLPLHPRLARVALYGKTIGYEQQALEFILKFSEYKDSSLKQKEAFLNDIKFRLNQIKSSPQTQKALQSQKFSSSMLFLSGFPDRLGKKEGENSSETTTYQLGSGRKAVAKINSASAPNWIVAVELDAGESTAKIYSYQKIEFDEIKDWIEQNSTKAEKLEFDGGSKTKIKKIEVVSFGAIVLKQTLLPPSSADFAKAICTQIQTQGFCSVPYNDASVEFLRRAIFYAQKKDSSLLQKISLLQKTVDEWLLPFINENSLDAKTFFDALYWHLEGQKVDGCVPIFFTLSNGKKARVKYEAKNVGEKAGFDDLLTDVKSLKIIPVIEIIIQQIFGCFSTPKVLETTVLLKLLSPARRPLQITDDLENFWQGAWVQICKEMKGRYPKHKWDYRVSD